MDLPFDFVRMTITNPGGKGVAVGVSGFGCSALNAAPAFFISRKRPPGWCQSTWMVALLSRRDALDNHTKPIRRLKVDPQKGPYYP